MNDNSEEVLPLTLQFAEELTREDVEIGVGSEQTGVTVEFTTWETKENQD